MIFTVYSFLISTLMASVMIVIYTILNRRKDFLIKFGVESLLFLAGICMLRMIFSVEFPKFQYIIGIPLEEYPISKESIHLLLHTAIFIMIADIVFSLLRFIHKYRSSRKRLRKCKIYPNPLAAEILAALPDSHKLEIYQISGIEVPMVLGYLHPTIYLPDQNYTREDLERIILHEYTHWKGKDLWIKLAVNIIVAFFWWNPLFYLLFSNLDETLELRCDRRVIKFLSPRERLDYAQFLISTLDEISVSHNNHICSSKLIGIAENKHFIYDRFEYITSPGPSKGLRIRNNLTFIVLGLIFYVMSYYIIIQPSFPPPTIEEMTDPGTEMVLTPENSYIKKVGDNYYIYSEGYPPTKLPKKLIEDGMSDEYFRNK